MDEIHIPIEEQTEAPGLNETELQEISRENARYTRTLERMLPFAIRGSMLRSMLERVLTSMQQSQGILNDALQHMGDSRREFITKTNDYSQTKPGTGNAAHNRQGETER